MFELTPRSVAILEILLLLSVAAFVGWLFARLMLNNRIRAVRSAITDQEAALAESRRSKVNVPTPVMQQKPVAASSQPATMSVLPSSDLISTEDTTITERITDAPATDGPKQSLVEPLQPRPEPIVALPAGPGGSEAAVLERIAARASELNFDRIGLAAATKADDLKDIVGVGPFLERKLHCLGIYTFRQVANFDQEDMAKVNEIIEFFPGRIQQDDWVGQAKVFYKRKYGDK